jgi:hypothetical protein
VTKYLRTSPYREERFILAYSFRDFIPWSLGCVAFWACGRAKHDEIAWQRKPVHFVSARK